MIIIAISINIIACLIALYNCTHERKSNLNCLTMLLVAISMLIQTIGKLN